MHTFPHNSNILYVSRQLEVFYARIIKTRKESILNLPICSKICYISLCLFPLYLRYFLFSITSKAIFLFFSVSGCKLYDHPTLSGKCLWDAILNNHWIYLFEFVVYFKSMIYFLQNNFNYTNNKKLEMDTYRNWHFLFCLYS